MCNLSRRVVSLTPRMLWGLPAGRPSIFSPGGPPEAGPRALEHPWRLGPHSGPCAQGLRTAVRAVWALGRLEIDLKEPAEVVP